METGPSCWKVAPKAFAFENLILALTIIHHSFLPFRAGISGKGMGYHLMFRLIWTNLIQLMVMARACMERNRLTFSRSAEQFS